MGSSSLTQTIRPARLVASPALPIAATAGLSLFIGFALVSKPILVIGLVALGLAAIGIAVAFSHPAVAFVGLIAIAALIPSYAAPAIGPFLFIPAAAASWLLAVVLGWRNLLLRGRIFRPTIVDLWVGAFVLLMAISIAFSPRASRNEYLHLIFLWAGPYLGVRLLLADVANPLKLVAASFAIITAILAPIALLEHLGGSNPFHVLDFNSGEFAIWAQQASRYGQVRAETSFGHPIALSMFVASSALFSIAAALLTKVRRERNIWYAAAAVAIGVQILTVSRTGWLMLLVGMIGIFIVFARGASRRRLLTLITTVGVAVIATSALAPAALQSLPGFEKSSTQVQSSSDYRQNLLKRALEPGVLNPWGNAQNEVTPFVNKGSATDNEYIILADSWGLIPVAALFLLAFSLLGIVARSYASDCKELVAFPIVAFANLVALFVVAFITQQQVVIWMLIGASAVAAERLAADRREARLSATRILRAGNTSTGCD
jgi:hypothetical protein